MDPLQTTSPRTQVSQLQLNIIRVPVLDLYAGAVKTATVQTATGKRETEKTAEEKWATEIRAMGNQYQEKRQREFGQQQYGQRQIGGPLCYVKIYICILTYSISYDKTCFRAFGRKKTKEAT